MSDLDTDVLIVGAGAAALVTALNVRKRRVCVLAPGASAEPCTASDLAQGGIAAAVGEDDSPALHLEDTMRAGRRHNLQYIARLVCEEAPVAVKYLASLGVGFAQTDGCFSLHKEAAHSRARVLHAGGDATGAALMQTLRRRMAEQPNVDVLPRMRAVTLLHEPSRVHGVVAVTGDGQLLTLRARDVVIATGGLGSLFGRSTNPVGACGDGPAMALAAGVRCADLEFVQFHPTALDVNARPMPLMTEALRGSGARLVDDAGDRFMQDVHPLGDLAPRDVVARAIYAVQTAGGRVWLDATNLDVMNEFSSVYTMCRAHGIDPVRELIPVTPAAHYHMGGIAVDMDGRASLSRLWAVGEAACTGLHGANRLASNSLLEAVVFGRRLARALDLAPVDATTSRCHTRAIDASPSEAMLMRELGEMMWRCMGLIRDAGTLAEGLAIVKRLRARVSPHAVLTRSRLLLAEEMITAAILRAASCGAHFRSESELERQGLSAAAGAFCRSRQTVPNTCSASLAVNSG